VITFTSMGLLVDLIGLLVLAFRRRGSIQAENLVLRRQLALFKERGVKPLRIDCAPQLLDLTWTDRAARLEPGCGMIAE
jgi:hypothetical protein